MSSPQIISIEGNIGSGKSTLLEKLITSVQCDKKIIFLKEPVDEWSNIKDENNITMLEKFYAEPEKYSFPFQMMAYISRLEILKNAIINNPDAIIITERSLYTDKLVFAQMLYDTNKIEYINFQIYLKWFDAFISDFPVSKVIYVKTSPEICYSRISQRSRTGESNIPLDYLIQCDKYHENMINNINSKQLVLDGNVNIYEDINKLYEWIEQINNFIKL
jgi:deoxyadenosine/deoxycytidine kinase